MEFAHEKASRQIEFSFRSKLVRGGILLDYEMFDSPAYSNLYPQDALKHDVERVAKDFWAAVKKHNNDQLAASG